ncbi:MAG: hypothetical protein NVV74_02890 [Magnetospirillum sp.]|nr:hypothetical protein [Magnetospirillum sp.]
MDEAAKRTGEHKAATAAGQPAPRPQPSLAEVAAMAINLYALMAWLQDKQRP